MAIADGLPIVEKTSLFGTALHAVMRRGTADPEAALRRALEAGGVTIDTMEPVVPSLDDVFLDVVDRA
jgi:ABC-2 type transport system ATP-binding protein